MRKKGRRVALWTGVAVALLLVTAGVYWDDILVWYRLARDFERLADNEQGYPEYRHRQTGIVFVRLPGGKCFMGTTKAEAERLANFAQRQWSPGVLDLVASEQPRHRVTLSPLLIAKYEVTTKAWQQIMGDVHPYLVCLRASLLGLSDLPLKLAETTALDHVPWEDALEFCRRTGLQLPTEGQWEYACRAGTEGPFAGNGELRDMGWYQRSCKSHVEINPVGTKRPNGFGIHDMHGNVREWCRDTYDSDFYSRPEATGSDPVCTSGSPYRVVRGGSKGDERWFCRSSARLYWLESAERFDNVGLRPVFNLR